MLKIYIYFLNLYLFFKKIIDSQTVQAVTEVLQGNKGENRVYLAVPLDQKKFRKIETNFTVDLSNTDLIEKLNLIADVKFIKIM